MSLFLPTFPGPARDSKAPHLLLQRRLRALPLSRDFFHRGREENTTPLTEGCSKQTQGWWTTCPGLVANWQSWSMDVYGVYGDNAVNTRHAFIVSPQTHKWSSQTNHVTNSYAHINCTLRHSRDLQGLICSFLEWKHCECPAMLPCHLPISSHNIPTFQPLHTISSTPQRAPKTPRTCRNGRVPTPPPGRGPSILTASRTAWPLLAGRDRAQS